MIYFDTRYALIAWDEEAGSAIIEWRGYVEGEEYRCPLERLLEVVSARGTDRILADLRRSKVINPPDQEWVNTSWWPRAQKAGLRYFALVTPESTTARLSLKRMAKIAGGVGRGDTAHFSSIEEAKAWLRSKPRGKA